MEKIIDKKIIDFIKKHHVLALATSDNNKPYCSTMFYVYSEEENIFIFTSENKTKHVKDFLNNKYVAGAIALETSIVGKIQGIQFTGTIKQPDESLLKKMKHKYIKRFPVAAFTKLDLWAFEPDYMKLTDNRLGFGKKIIWER